MEMSELKAWLIKQIKDTERDYSPPRGPQLFTYGWRQALIQVYLKIDNRLMEIKEEPTSKTVSSSTPAGHPSFAVYR